ncbi:hypothetical protein ACIG0C_05680 [Kitasatospora aureofaciens]|uniref:Uncharacterized protein n=1 Tax=Kitasatospora aureofaciens TaxID=1894 RepID=A0A1E7N2X8_KITAU|nr:hypothetical protein [Kitasatospora aureofaciens]OEV35059.1 hypothetical protein HS99_0034575 [Kitasatospora aureofaciens]GGU69632.1 hypothetical protein GCM10010502_21070 [Kitasatospora aureofaciens]
MLTHTANGGDSRLSFWRRVREYAVPPSMIEAATARRLSGDWACAAANVEIDFQLPRVARAHGREFAERLRGDLRCLAPDLLRWHLPRTAPDGLLRAGLTVPLVRYPGERPVHLVVRTPPAWAEYGQRISLALWDGSSDGPAPHPHPRPSRRFRLDLHRHLWDADRSGELALRAGLGRPAEGPQDRPRDGPDRYGLRHAVDRWAAEAEVLLRAEGRQPGPVVVRLEHGRRLLLTPNRPNRPNRLDDPNDPTQPDGPPEEAADDLRSLPLLPDAATWVLPDVDLLRSDAIEPDRLHPLVAAALAPGHRADRRRQPTAGQRLVECRGAQHRIAVVDGVLTALDHDPAQLRREELLASLSGTPLPCLRAIDQAHRDPAELAGVRERLDHGDTAGALAVVEGLLGPQAALRDGPLRDQLAAAAERRVAYGLYRAGLTIDQRVKAVQSEASYAHYRTPVRDCYRTIGFPFPRRPRTATR